MSLRTRSGRRIGSSIACGALATWIVAMPLGGATIPVGTLLDDFTPNGNCTLREALYAAQLNVPIDACPAGDLEVTDLVTLDAGFHEVDLGPLLIANSDVIVRGRIPVPNGPSVVSSSNASRIFDVSGGASVVLQRLRVLEGNAGTTATGLGGGVRAVDARLELVDVVVVGNTAAEGGGVHYVANGEHELVVRRTRFESNSAMGTPGGTGGEGGALYLALGGGASATIVDSIFEANRSDSTATTGGAMASALSAVVDGHTGPSSLLVRRTRFLGNLLVCAPATQGDGTIYLISQTEATATLVDLEFAGNDSQDGCHNDSTTALRLHASAGVIVLDRLRLTDEDAGEVRHHVLANVSNGGSLTATNLLLARGPETGIEISSIEGETALGHLTVTEHAGRSVRFFTFPTASTVLDNSILWANGDDAPQISGTGAVLLRSNLVGIDPLFVDPAGGDFGLQEGSPAMGAGDRTLPTVRFADAAHAPRIFGAQTDAGAYERRGLWADGFELGDATDWSAVVPLNEGWFHGSRRRRSLHPR